MSLFQYELDCLTVKPKINITPESLTIRNSSLGRVLTLFLHLCKVDFYFDREYAVFSTTWFYFFRKTSVIGFSQFTHLDYTYDSMGTSWGFNLTGFGRYDQVETFSISLVTRDECRHKVCSFRGEGTALTGWSGVLMGDDLIDLSGSQESESRLLVSYLSQKLGIPLSKPHDYSSLQRTCHSCGRQTAKLNPACLYCGARPAGTPAP